MGALIIINVLVYTHNGVSPVTSSMCSKTNIGCFPKNLFDVYTPSSGPPESFSGSLHTFWLFRGLQFLCLHTCWFTKKKIVYISTGDSPTINVIVDADFGG